MVAYLTDARLAIVNRREGYVSWAVYNLFLTPAHDWIHDCEASRAKVKERKWKNLSGAERRYS